jgi:hypothetical protein
MVLQQSALDRARVGGLSCLDMKDLSHTAEVLKTNFASDRFGWVGYAHMMSFKTTFINKFVGK